MTMARCTSCGGQAHTGGYHHYSGCPALMGAFIPGAVPVTPSGNPQERGTGSDFAPDAVAAENILTEYSLFPDEDGYVLADSVADALYAASRGAAPSSGEGGISDEDRHWNGETLWDICREVGRILYPERDGGIYPGPRTAISEIRKIGVELAELRAQTAGDVDLPTAPCPWCHRHYTAAGWGDHYDQRHESQGQPFVPFDTIERWYSSTDSEQMALTLSDIVSLYVTEKLPAGLGAPDEVRAAVVAQAVAIINDAREEGETDLRTVRDRIERLASRRAAGGQVANQWDPPSPDRWYICQEHGKTLGGCCDLGTLGSEALRDAEAGDDRSVAGFACESDQPEVQAALRQRDMEQDVEQMVRHDAEEADYRTPLASREASPLLWEAVSDNFWRAKLAGAQVGFVVKANTSPRLGEWEATTTAPYAASSLMTRHHKLDAAKAAVAARIQDGFAPSLRALLASPAPSSGEPVTDEAASDALTELTDAIFEYGRAVGNASHALSGASERAEARTAKQDAIAKAEALAALASRHKTAGQPSWPESQEPRWEAEGKLWLEVRRLVEHILPRGRALPDEYERWSAEIDGIAAFIAKKLYSPRCAAGGQGE